MIIYHSGNIPAYPVLLDNECWEKVKVPDYFEKNITLMISYALGNMAKKSIRKIIKSRIRKQVGK